MKKVLLALLTLGVAASSINAMQDNQQRHERHASQKNTQESRNKESRRKERESRRSHWRNKKDEVTTRGVITAASMQ
jgi:hypothetical protein